MLSDNQFTALFSVLAQGLSKIKTTAYALRVHPGDRMTCLV
ncbi:hypothetical protein HMPREF0201_01497 [Cedecea davisae DSM 4568]|uniref:Uncharacterized protein n=1 Tax=Cedecea davisae DSM 4568 TaxID=566551 RepID=S3J010_9ENTR|nr:hypothetical protein HMPREF0201_01497 [Cedecea davisae DSM 4568]